MLQSLLRIAHAYRGTPGFQHGVWITWGIVFGIATWLYLWSLGLWAMVWTDSFDLVPIAVSAALSAMILDHVGIKRWKTGVMTLVVALWLLPALDLLISPGCAGVDSIELYRTTDGSLDTRCAETADMTTEGLTAVAGLAGVSVLVAILTRLRKKD